MFWIDRVEWVLVNKDRNNKIIKPTPESKPPFWDPFV